jgi:fibronectin-binding autotransporter adhesin
MLRKLLFGISLIGTGMAVVPLPMASGQTTAVNFTGATDSDMSKGTNWSNGTAPAFGTSITNIRWNINGTAEYTAAQGATTITIDNSAATNNAFGRAMVLGNPSQPDGHLTISGGSLTLNGRSSVAISSPNGLDSAGGADRTANSTLTLSGGNLTIRRVAQPASGSVNSITAGELAIVFRGDAATTAVVTIGNGSTLDAERVVFGGVTTNGGLPNNTVSIGATGTLNINAGGTLKTGQLKERSEMNSHVNLNGGTIQATGAANQEWISGNQLRFTNNIPVGASGGTLVEANELSGSMSLTLVAGSTSTLDSGGLAGQRVTADITGSGALRVAGGGSMVFETANTYTGGTTVAGNTILSVTQARGVGTGSVFLDNNATLRALTTPVTIGDGVGTLETLSLAGRIDGNALLSGVSLEDFGGTDVASDVTGNLSLTDSSLVSWSFGGSAFNQLRVGGLFTLADNTVFNIGNAALTSSYYDLGSFGSFTGDFANIQLTGDAASLYKLTTAGNTFGLTAVPEPSSIALLGLVGSAVAVRRRMKQKAKAKAEAMS